MEEIALKDIFKILKKRLWLIILLPIVAAVAAFVIVNYAIIPVYTSTATMYVLNKQNEDNVVNYNDLQSGTLLTADYRELALSKRVLAPVAEEYNLNAGTLQSDFNITVEAANNTRVIEISATAPDPVLAANIANSVGYEFSYTVSEIMDVSNVNFVDMAEASSSPSAPKKMRLTAIAGLAGFVLAVGIALAIDFMNTTIRTKEDVENYLELTVLANIPKLKNKGK